MNLERNPNFEKSARERTQVASAFSEARLFVRTSTAGPPDDSNVDAHDHHAECARRTWRERCCSHLGLS